MPQHPIANPKAGRTRPPRPEAERRDRLRDAAAEMSIARGFDATNTSEIARRAGASKTTLYWRPTGEQLFLGGIEHRMNEVSADRSAARVVRAVGAVPTPSSVPSMPTRVASISAFRIAARASALKGGPE